MNIQIDDKTRITSDAHNFIIQKLTGKDKQGNDVWTGKKFYTSIGAMLRGLHQQKLRNTACTSMAELGAAIKESTAYLEDLAAQIEPQVA